MTASRSAGFRRTSRWTNIPPRNRARNWCASCKDHQPGRLRLRGRFHQRQSGGRRQQTEVSRSVPAQRARCASISAARRFAWIRSPRPARSTTRITRRRSTVSPDVWRDAAGIAQGCGHPPGVGVRAGLRLQQAVRSGGHAPAGGASEFLHHVRHLARLHVRAWWARASTARKETLPGGVAEFLKKLRGPHRRDPPDRFRRHAARRRDQHAPAVRRGLHRFQGARAASCWPCRTSTGGASTCASGRAPGNWWNRAASSWPICWARKPSSDDAPELSLQVSAAGAITLRELRAESTLRVAEHPVARAKFPGHRRPHAPVRAGPERPDSPKDAS